MRNRIAAGLAVITAGLVVLAGISANFASAEDKSKIAPPKHLYGHDLRVRKGGNPNFEPDTPRIGVEFFHDETTKTIIAISDSGTVAVAQAPVVRWAWIRHASGRQRMTYLAANRAKPSSRSKLKNMVWNYFKTVRQTACFTSLRQET